MSTAPIEIHVMTDDELARLVRDDGRAAGFGALETARGLLPLTAMDVDARVAGIVASIEVAQTFVNTTGATIEATYIFPLPDRAAVHRFRMEVAGRVVEGVVDERAAAREQYDQAIAAGHRAAITEEERAGVFTMRVGNLLPGETATVRLSLVGPLPVDDGEVTFRFPLVVAPRYIPGRALEGDQAGLGVALDTHLVPDASRISPPVLLPGVPNPVRLGVRVALEDARVRDVSSSLHAITTSSRDAQVIELAPGARLDRDVILRWQLASDELRSSLVCADDEDGRGGTFLLTLAPPSAVATGAKPRDVVFVLDRSGSMNGWKMVAARRAVARMIDTLTSRDRFCAIAFDNRFELLPDDKLVEATDRARFRAIEALAKVDARGGTELARPLARAAKLVAGGTLDRERVIVLVTDGQVGNEDQILRELVPELRNVRVFTLGIDQAVNAAFLRRLAAAGGGLCELVESEDRLDTVMAKVHRRIGMPVATELALQGVGLAIDPATVSPARLPDVHAGAPVTILGRYQGRAGEDAAIELTGTTLGEPLRVTVAREPAADPAPWLAASWARASIRDLEDQYAVRARTELEQKIVALSKHYGVLSRFTAYLAVDRSEVANPGGRLKQVVQPVDLPAGWAEEEAVSMPAMAMPMSAPGGAPPIYAEAAAPRERMRGAGAPPAPPAPAPVAPRRAKAAARVTLGASTSAAIDPVSSDAYRALLEGLARELAAALQPIDAPVVRRVRQRLVEWIEDVRSVGGLDALADAVDALVKRLSSALAGGAVLADEVRAIADALAELAAGEPPAPAPKKSRLAFWK